MHKDCEDRVRAFGKGSDLHDGLVHAYNAIERDARDQDLPSATLVIGFYDADCELSLGDWVPEIHLVMRRLEDERRDDPIDTDWDTYADADAPGGGYGASVGRGFNAGLNPRGYPGGGEDCDPGGSEEGAA